MFNNVTEGTLALAAATGTDLATSAAVGGATLRGFGLDAKETGRVTDVMAMSFASSALDMTKFQDSMKYVAPVAKLAGFGIEGTTAMLGQLANAGIDGSMAGTALRKVFLELSNENSKLSKRLGGSVKSVDELIPALKKLNKEGVSTAEMKDMVGQRAISAFSILLAGSADVDKLTGKLRDAGGAAQIMADIQLDTREGRMTIMKSATEGLGIALFDHLSPGLNEVVEGMTDLISATTKWLEIPSSEKMEEERASADSLFAVLSSGNLTEETRKRLIGEINVKYGDLITTQLTQKSTLEDIEKANNEVTNSLIRQIAVEESREDIAKIMRELKVLREEETQLVSKQLESENQLITETEKHEQALEKARIAQVKYNKTHGETSELVNQGNNSFGMQIEELENLQQATGYQTNASELSGIAMANAGFEMDSNTDAVIKNQIEQGILVQSMGEVERKAIELADSLTKAGKARLGLDGEDGEDDDPVVKTFRERADAASKAMMKYSEESQALQATMSVAGNIYGQMSSIKQKDIDMTKKRLKEEGKSEKEIAQITKKATEDLQETRYRQAQFAAFEAAINAYNSLVGTPFVGPVLAPIAGVAALGFGLKQAEQIKAAEFGMDSIVDSPTLILAGEKNQRESVQITPLEGPNIDGPQGGGSVTVNVSGNLMSSEYVEGELADQIKNAIRRGTDYGIS